MLLELDKDMRRLNKVKLQNNKLFYWCVGERIYVITTTHNKAELREEIRK